MISTLDRAIDSAQILSIEIPAPAPDDDWFSMGPTTSPTDPGETAPRVPPSEAITAARRTVELAIMTEVIPGLEVAFPHVQYPSTEGGMDLVYQSATDSAFGGLYVMQFESEMRKHANKGWGDVLDKFQSLRGYMTNVESGGAERRDLSEFQSGVIYGRPKTWDRSQMADHKAETDWLRGGWDTGSVETWCNPATRQ